MALWRKNVTPIQFTWLNDTEAQVIVVGRLKDLLNPLRRVDSPGLSIPCDFCFSLSLFRGNALCSTLPNPWLSRLALPQEVRGTSDIICSSQPPMVSGRFEREEEG